MFNFKEGFQYDVLSENLGTCARFICKKNQTTFFDSERPDESILFTFGEFSKFLEMCLSAKDPLVTYERRVTTNGILKKISIIFSDEVVRVSLCGSNQDVTLSPQSWDVFVSTLREGAFIEKVA